MPGRGDRNGRKPPGGSGAGADRRTNPLLEAALAYAARGWPVLPCDPTLLPDGKISKRPLNAAARDPKTGKAIKGTGGVSAASTDPEQIRSWWGRWPLAMVGIAAGHGWFALDFDPRHDGDTGEEWTLERLKAETEAQIGCALPATLAVRTPSGGVHLYFACPEDDGPPIRNRGNLPLHVDVRGAGGYVVAPPSVTSDGLRYRWLRGDAEAPIAVPPAELVAVLRARSGPRANSQPAAEASNQNDVAGDQPAALSSSPPSPPAPGAARPSTLPASAAEAAEEAVRHYAEAALDAECRTLAATPHGNRDNQANASGFAMGQLVGACALELGHARSALHAACQGFGDPAGRAKAVDNGLDAGQAQPRDLAAVRDEALRRWERYGPRRPAGSAAPPPDTGDGSLSAPFRSGRYGSEPDGAEAEEPLSEAERARFAKCAEAWLARRLLHAEKTAKALKAIAWGTGRRAAGGLIDAGVAKDLIWPACEDVVDISHADVDRAIEDGFNRGFDAKPLRLVARCTGYPMTDFGIAERFRDRFGEDFRFTTAKGWLGWDGRRWKVLDQEKDVPPAEVIAAVFETVRAIQGEARFVAETGVKWSLIREGKEQRLDLDDEGNPHGLDRWIPKGRGFELLSTKLAAFGRASETSGKPAAIAGLARRWLTLPIEAFDVDPRAINVLNGTLRFERERVTPAGNGGLAVGAVARWRVSCKLTDHKRADMNTRLAPVEYDAAAECPTYDGFFAWAHPEDATRRYLHQVAGYGFSGETSEQKLWFHYGLGANGKSTWMDLLAEVAGDYSGSIGIETFLDQGIKKRGEQASPDLARLGGVRFLRSSEPERGSKLNEALVKAATGGEPMPVRALHRGFFDLRPLFKLHIGGNYKPDIPGTDEGIWRRMKLVPWNSHVADQDRDEGLPTKLRAEAAGVFNHVVRGLLDWLEHGLVEPDAVKAATAQYRDDSDPLARFLRLCTAADPDGRVQSSRLYDVFAAWCKAAGEREWKQKGFSQAMTNKGFVKKASDGMQWLGLKLVRAASDFVDENGRVLEQLPDLDPPAAAPPRPPPGNEDDLDY
jgi:putative DNA primase/helicase